MSRGDELVTIEGFVKLRGAKAIFVKTVDGGEGWVPLSCLDDPDQYHLNYSGMIRLKRWIAEEKEFDYV